jgi:flagellar hook-length control protein FliK
MTAAQSAAPGPDASDAVPTDQAPAVATAGGGSDKGTAAFAATTAKMQTTSGGAVQQAQTQGQANDTAPLASAQTDASAPVNPDRASARAADLSGVSSSSAGGTSNAQNGAAGTKTDANGLPNLGFSVLAVATPSAAMGSASSGSASTAAAVPVAGLAVAIAARAQSGSNQFDIRLDPPELGRIDVRLDVNRDGQVTTHMTAERADTLQLLQSQQPQIEQALQQAGLKTADNGLQFTLRDQSFTGGQNNGSGAQTNGSAQVVIPDPDLAPIAATQIYTRAGLGSGIDIRV